MVLETAPAGGESRSGATKLACGEVAVARRRGLFGCGSLSDAEGEPLRPGGLALTRELIGLANFRSGEAVVDVGCGLGASVRLLGARGVAAVGVDLVSPPGGPAGAPFIVADAARLPFADASLDGVLSECSLSLAVDRRETLVEWFRVLNRGGRLALSDLYCRAGEGVGRIASRETLCLEIAAAGFRVSRFEDRSETLKGWTARFIFRHGSLDALWSGDWAIEGEATKLGYCALVAVKPGASQSGGG